MADIKSPEERSKNMSKIRSKGTAPEEYVRKKLFSRGYRYRKNVKTVPGHPDAWLPKYNTALFVHGCFWHRHQGCKYAYMPKSRTEFWVEKFDVNVSRDRLVHEQLSRMGIRYLIVWECTINAMVKSTIFREDQLREILAFLEGTEESMEL